VEHTAEDEVLVDEHAYLQKRVDMGVDTGGTGHQPGWWQASDGKWYAPELHARYISSLPPPPPTPALEAFAVRHSAAGNARTVEPARARTLPIRSMVLIAACLVYLLLPIDLVPEVALGPFGLGDDVVALLVMGKTALSLYQGSSGSSASKR
jgi:Protein of unknown function (DUF1232)